MKKLFGAILNPNCLQFNSKRKCENQFWASLFEHVKTSTDGNAEQTICPAINSNILKGSHEKIIAHPELNPACEKHAEVILKLSKGWTNADCKKSYRAMSPEYHPDKSELKNSKELFHKVQKAHDTLC